MSQSSQLIAEQYRNGQLTKTSFGEAFYIVTAYGVFPNGSDVTNDLQALVNLANSQGRTAIFFPAGEYYVTYINNDENVYYFGDNASFIGGYSRTIEQIGTSSSNDYLDVRKFGAIGDGVHDDTVAMQAWLDSPGKKRVLKNGTFKITANLVSSETDRTIVTDNAFILVDTENVIALTVTGDRNKISINVEGNNKATVGILAKGAMCEIKNCHLYNLYGTARAACGIEVDTTGGSIVRDNVIKNVSAVSNGILGDAIGAARAILIHAETRATAINLVKDNYIDTVLGEEGDAIQFLFYNGSTTPFLDGQGVIQGNTIRNCNRRAIKVQASNVRVKDNEHFNSLAETDLPNAAALIDVIQSDDVVVTNNCIESAFFLGIQATGSSSRKTQRCSVFNNTIKSGTSKNGMFFDHIDSCQIIDNVIYEGQIALAIQNSQYSSIDGNAFYGGDVTRVAINIVASNIALSVRNNLLLSGARNYLVQNAAPNCIVEGNHSRASVGGNIRTFVTSAGSIYKNNSNSSATNTVIGDFTDQFLSGSRNLGSGAVGIPDIASVASVPTLTTHPTKRWNQGDIVFFTAPTAGGKIGAVCTISGTPGTWKSFGAIDA